MTSKSSTTTNRSRRDFPPIHPGEILREEFLGPLGISQYRVAKAIKVQARRINEIVHEKRAISADTALRLARYFGTSVEFWTGLQASYDTELARAKAGDLDEILRFAPGAQRSAPSPRRSRSILRSRPDSSRSRSRA